MLTAVISQEMNVNARVTLETVYDCRCYAFICWNACEVAGLAAGGTSGNTAELPVW